MGKRLGDHTFEVSYTNGSESIAYADRFDVIGTDIASRYRFYREQLDKDGQSSYEEVVLDAPVINVNSVRTTR